MHAANGEFQLRFDVNTFRQLNLQHTGHPRISPKLDFTSQKLKLTACNHLSLHTTGNSFYNLILRLTYDIEIVSYALVSIWLQTKRDLSMDPTPDLPWPTSR